MEPAEQLSELVSAEGRNRKAVLCQRCGSRVLQPGTALFSRRQVRFSVQYDKRTASSVLVVVVTTGEEDEEAASALSKLSKDGKSSSLAKSVVTTDQKEHRSWSSGSTERSPDLIEACGLQLFLPSMRKKPALAEGSDPEGDLLQEHWLVEDMFVFENVGFTKDVGNIKFLVCADCEIGPIGWHCLDDKNSFYVALERVSHE